MKLFLPRTTLTTCASLLLVGGLMASAQSQTAPLDVTDAWVRGTVAGQKATGAFMKLKSVAGTRLVEVKSPVAGVVEMHEMSMEGDVMKMRSIGALDLPPGKVVEFKPGSFHVMLIDLKAPLKAGDKVPISLVLQDKAGVRQTVDLRVPVRALTADAMMDPHDNHKP